MRQLRAAGAGEVFHEVASEAKTDRRQLRRLLGQLAAGDVVMVYAARPAGTLDPRPSEYPRVDHRQKSRVSIPRRRVGDTTTAHGCLMLTVLGGLAEFERELIRARAGEGRERAKVRGRLGRSFRLTLHQRSEAVRRRDRGETLSYIARTYNVHPSTISRLTAS